MISRKGIRYRVGSTLLSLLVFVHLGAGLVHPCCLGSPVADESVEVAADGHEAHHAVPAPVQDAVHGGATEHGAQHQGAQHHGGEDEDCDGVCGFCCQTLDGVIAVESPTAFGQLAGPVAEALPTPFTHEERPAPAFLLPFANGPPIGSTLLG